jgi:mercuric ion transport protein
MWRDRWFALGVIGALLTCLACLTPLAVLALGAIGLGAWTGRLDVALLPLLVGFVALAVHRYRHARRRRAKEGA